MEAGPELAARARPGELVLAPGEPTKVQGLFLCVQYAYSARPGASCHFWHPGMGLEPTAEETSLPGGAVLLPGCVHRAARYSQAQESHLESHRSVALQTHKPCLLWLRTTL